MLFIQKVETPQTAGWTDENELSSHMTNYKHNNLVADQVSVLQRKKIKSSFSFSEVVE